MLILERSKDEVIVIDDNIRIKVLFTDRGKVRLGIEAPKEISVHREEVWEKIRAGEQ